MMEIMVFYWTGAAIWWTVLIITVVTILCTFLIFPIIIYRKMHQYFWQWKWAAVAATTGLSQDDIRWVIRVQAIRPNNASLEEMIAWFEAVKTRGASVRKVLHKKGN